MGIAKVEKTAYSDPTADDARWVGVELTPFKALKKPCNISAGKRRCTTGKILHWCA